MNVLDARQRISELTVAEAAGRDAEPLARRG